MKVYSSQGNTECFSSLWGWEVQVKRGNSALNQTSPSESWARSLLMNFLFLTFVGFSLQFLPRWFYKGKDKILLKECKPQMSHTHTHTHTHMHACTQAYISLLDPLLKQKNKSPWYQSQYPFSAFIWQWKHMLRIQQPGRVASLCGSEYTVYQS